MRIIFTDGIMEATQYPDGWIFLRWLDNKRGYLQKKLLQDLVKMESYIFDNKLKGWFTSSEKDHTDFQMLLHRIGAKFMMKDAAFVYFNKWIQKEGDKYVRKSPRRA